MIVVSMRDQKPIGLINTLRNGVGALGRLQPNRKAHLLLLEVGIQHHTRSIATNVEASLSEPHNFHHG